MLRIEDRALSRRSRGRRVDVVRNGRSARNPRRITMQGLRRSFAFGALCVLAAASVHAQVQPGDTINKANADKVKDLVSPGMYWCVQHGWPMKIIETKQI